jgi:hypothetical protein
MMPDQVADAPCTDWSAKALIAGRHGSPAELLCWGAVPAYGPRALRGFS